MSNRINVSAIPNITVADLKAAGWKEYRTAWTRGYISRKTDIDRQPVNISGTGEVYFLAPSWESTAYYLRVYMRPATR